MPPCDPGQSDFPNPVLTLVRLYKPFRNGGSLSAGSHSPLSLPIYLWTCFVSRVYTPWLCVQMLPFLETTKCPEPLCPIEALPLSARCLSASRPRALPLLLRSYGLMRQTLILPPPRLPTRLVGLCRLSPVPAGCWPFPTLSPYVFPWMLGPIPRRLPWCLRPFLPRGLRPSPRFDRVGFSATYPYSDFRTAIFLGAADIPLCSGLQVCSPPRSLQPIRPSSYGRRGFYFRASYSSFPPHTSDMLTARIGQLAVGDLHPIRLTVLSATPKTLNCYSLLFSLDPLTISSFWHEPLILIAKIDLLLTFLFEL